jgi:hypothetical protein
MQIAESFLQGRNQEVSLSRMHSPVFAGERMYYPFLPDFHAAVMKRTGGGSGTLRGAFLWAGFALASSLWPLLFHLTVRVTRSRLAGLLSVALTIGAGGIGFFAHAFGPGGSLSRALDVDTAQNDAGMGYTIFWFAFLPHVLLPQARTVLPPPRAPLPVL